MFVVECAGCRLLRLSPWPKAADMRRHYPAGFWLSGGGEAHSRIEEYYRRFLLRDHVAFVKSALQRAKVAGPVLEISSRGGWFLHEIASLRRQVVALDFDIAAASAAWHSKHAPAVLGTLAHPPFAPASFAAVAMFQVLEHLYDPAGHLEAAHRLLKPGGRLIVQVPNASCWQFLLLGERWNGLDAPRHLIQYRPKDLEILLDRCGFEVERWKYFALRDNPFGLASSLAPGWDPEMRRLSGRPESVRMRTAKDLLHQALTLASLPITILEAACHAGSTMMVEARAKK
jgi:SAM-dependent methyltransferase